MFERLISRGTLMTVAVLIVSVIGLMAALRKLADEDPTFTVGYDEQTRETIIAGMGELHLDIIADRLRREFNVPCEIAPPQAAGKSSKNTRMS
mgnify:CR=1 FL=1